MRRLHCLVVAALLRLRRSRLSDWRQPIISVTARLASVPIDGGESDVERLARGGEVYEAVRYPDHDVGFGRRDLAYVWEHRTPQVAGEGPAIAPGPGI